MNLEAIKNKIKEKWQLLPPDEKRKFVLIVIITLIVLVSYLAYVTTRGEKQVVSKKESNVTTKEISVDTGLLERSYYTESQAQYQQLKEQFEALQKAFEEERAKREEEEKKRKELENIERTMTSYKETPPPPPPPSYSPPPPPTTAGPTSEKMVQPPTPVQQVVGDITIVQASPYDANRTAETSKEEQVEGKKKYYLPPSFMEATLLSGLDAPAIQKGEGHPVPCLFRIKAPAVLPNKVKANLKGCFVIGEALGNLASERADIRLVSLSCIDKKGKAVIDQKIKGFVVDNDGKIGLRGRVVSKMGSTIARALIAGLASGLGSVFGQQAYTYTFSPQGTLVLPKPEESLRAALGSGVQQATQQIQQFYLDLARQTVPVVEILALRNVTLVISEGLWLDLKDYETLK